jgi:hypothetical protein
MLAMGSRPVVTTFSAVAPVASPMPFGVAAMQTSQSLSAISLGKQAERFAGGSRVNMEM